MFLCVYMFVNVRPELLYQRGIQRGCLRNFWGCFEFSAVDTSNL